MKIEVLGSGCTNCKKLFELTKKAISELNQRIEVEHITNIQRILELGLMQSPVLIINGKPVLVGFIPDIEKIKSIIKNNLS